MSRLLVHVEGETEETFVNEVLRSHLHANGYGSVKARILGNSRLRHFRGGIRGWDSVKKDIVNHLREDRDCIVTTMVDYYGLPATGLRSWPGREEANQLHGAQKAAHVEAKIREDISAAMGGGFNPRRFIPFVVLHEFEGLLFSNCEAFSDGIGHPDLVEQLLEIRNQFQSPEDINDSPVTAPSKRIKNLVSGYQKPLHGNIAAIEIGLDSIRKECPHFSEWLASLEAATN